MSVDCAALLRELQAFIDGELDAPSCAEIREHLERCAPCLSTADLEAAFKSLVARSCQESPPPGLLDRITQALD